MPSSSISLRRDRALGRVPLNLHQTKQRESRFMRDLSKLKICFLAGTLEHGGAERQLFYILQALRQASAGLRLLSLDRGEFWEEKIKALGVSVTCVGDKPSRLHRLFRVLKEMRKD